MARNARIQILRTTRAALDAQATAGGLFAGEPYWITDESVLAVGTGASGYDVVDLPAASQAEMEAGTETALRSMSPLRVAQAVAALATTGVFPFYQADGAAAPIHLTGASALPFFVASGDAAHISLVI